MKTVPTKYSLKYHILCSTDPKNYKIIFPTIVVSGVSELSVALKFFKISLFVLNRTKNVYRFVTNRNVIFGCTIPLRSVASPHRESVKAELQSDLDLDHTTGKPDLMLLLQIAQQHEACTVLL